MNRELPLRHLWQRRKRYCGDLVLGVLLLVTPATSQLPRHIVAPQGGVACAEIHAAQVGVRILQQGGNAMDALVGVGFAMAVTYPRAGNLGGGGFILYRNARSGKVTAFDFRETAPAAASFDMYWDRSGKPDREKSRIGALALGVPGTVRGLALAHQKHGRLPWKALIRPAVELARFGFVVDSSLYGSLKARTARFQQFPESFSIFFPDGEPPRPGTLFIQKDLAHTLALIAERGPDAFYTGEIARKIVAAVKKYGGILSLTDLQNYRAKERAPVVFTYRGYTIYSMPPPSSGGLTLQGILKTLEHYPLHQFEHNGADYMALVSEVEKHWYAKRNLHLGDPDFVKIPFQLFSSPEVIQRIRQQIQLQRPLPARSMPEYAMIIHQENPQTTHISIVDAAGNAAAMTYTLNGSYGSFLVAQGTGILLNNEMDDFSTRPGHPNMYGLVQGWANAIQPGKRMLSSMTPTLVVQNGQLIGVLGTPGGSTIITSVLQVLLNKIDFGMSLAEAVEKGRFHQQWLPDSIAYEQHRFDVAVLEELQRRGFGLTAYSKIGDIQAIWKTANGWEISSDPRRSGFPIGF